MIAESVGNVWPTDPSSWAYAALKEKSIGPGNCQVIKDWSHTFSPITVIQIFDIVCTLHNKKSALIVHNQSRFSTARIVLVGTCFFLCHSKTMNSSEKDLDSSNLKMESRVWYSPLDLSRLNMVFKKCSIWPNAYSACRWFKTGPNTNQKYKINIHSSPSVFWRSRCHWFH